MNIFLPYENDKCYTVYKHIFPNNKVYIGITSQKTQDRWLNGKGYKDINFVGKAIRKYGWENVKHEILYENLTKSEAEEKEIELISFYKSNNKNYGYNIQNGGNGKGKLSEAEKERLRKSALGNKRWLGKHHTEESKQKIREKHIDRFNYIKIQEIIDENNDEVNAIVCSSANKRLYQQYLLDHNQPIEYIECFGLKNILKFNNNYMMFYNNDLPDNEIYLINTNDFRFHELCDWQWISDENDNVLKQVESKPVYRATLVKYGNYMCHKPHRQIKVTIGENND